MRRLVYSIALLLICVDAKSDSFSYRTHLPFDSKVATLPLIAGPAFLALLLGHRINATAPIQSYEWVGSGKYVPTCRFD
jgi:SMODS-associated and fused to various effectors sensor domain